MYMDLAEAWPKWLLHIFQERPNTVLIFHVSSVNVLARIEDLQGYSSVSLKLKKYRWHFHIYEI